MYQLLTRFSDNIVFIDHFMNLKVILKHALGVTHANVHTFISHINKRLCPNTLKSNLQTQINKQSYLWLLNEVDK